MAGDVRLLLTYVHIIMSVGDACVEYWQGTICVSAALDFLYSSPVLPGEFQNNMLNYFMIISFCFPYNLSLLIILQYTIQCNITSAVN
jgi:hypothetical protein